MKHTRGPWVVRDIASRQRYIGPSNDGGAPSVALVMSRVNVPDALLDADARLIAAAPDLLNAVRLLLSNPFNRITKADVEAAQDAIAKATGEQQ